MVNSRLKVLRHTGHKIGHFGDVQRDHFLDHIIELI